MVADSKVILNQACGVYIPVSLPPMLRTSFQTLIFHFQCVIVDCENICTCFSGHFKNQYAIQTDFHMSATLRPLRSEVESNIFYSYLQLTETVGD